MRPWEKFSGCFNTCFYGEASERPGAQNSRPVCLETRDTRNWDFQNSHEYQEFSKTYLFCKTSLSKLSHTGLYYSIVVYTVTIYSSTRYNHPLVCVVLSLSRHAQWKISYM